MKTRNILIVLIFFIGLLKLVNAQGKYYVYHYKTSSFSSEKKVFESELEMHFWKLSPKRFNFYKGYWNEKKERVIDTLYYTDYLFWYWFNQLNYTKQYIICKEAGALRHYAFRIEGKPDSLFYGGFPIDRESKGFPEKEWPRKIKFEGTKDSVFLGKYTVAYNNIILIQKRQIEIVLKWFIKNMYLSKDSLDPKKYYYHLKWVKEIGLIGYDEYYDGKLIRSSELTAITDLQTKEKIEVKDYPKDSKKLEILKNALEE